MTRQSRAMRLTPIEIGLLAALALFLMAVVPVACRQARQEATESVCTNNLALLGRAMIVYAGDYDGRFPRASGENAQWGSVCWDAPNRMEAYGHNADGVGGRATIGSNLYLLVKYAEVSPATFICPTDLGVHEFKLAEHTDGDLTLTDIWDFGDISGEHYSYAYHCPFGPYPLTTSRDPGLAVLADRNPWIVGQPFERFVPDIPPYNGTAKQACAGNTTSHDGTGQNVLFLDGHVRFKERPYCGLDNDNVYTISDKSDGGSPAGGKPWFGQSEPKNPRDSVLLTDPAPYRDLTTQVAPQVDSYELQQTVIVPTRDCPLPQQRNAIWCATFQMAWDQYKTEFTGGPIILHGAEELANRLNNSRFPLDSLEASSYYVATGPATDSVLDRIERDMAHRFPNASIPDLRRYVTTDMTLAFAYLGMNLEFEHPFRVNESAFTFTASNGDESPVTSFSTYADSPEPNDPVRTQVEILSYEYGSSRDEVTFAVDLCTHTEPYQVILARMPRSETLRATIDSVEQAIARFKDDPDYETLRRLRTIDQLTVPDVLYNLIHHFTELEGRPFGNADWTGARSLLALQTIEFSLSRTGVILRSVAVFAASRRSEQIQEPRLLYFDRPFLIYAKKRRPDAQPFFAMWVDNAELLRPYQRAGAHP